MAKCPNCQYHLKPWNIKAECPSCGVNIPNFDWEKRLDEDAIRSEISFAKLHERTSNFKTTFTGSKLRIIRLIFTFIPLVLLVIPIIKVNVNLPFVEGAQSVSALTAILWIVKNSFDFGSLLALAKGAVTGKMFIYLFATVALFVLSILVAVINFFLLLIRSFGLGNIANIVCNTLSTLLITASVFTYFSFANALSATTVNFISDPAPGICLFAGIALFILNTVLNILSERQIRPMRKAFHEKRAEEKNILEQSLSAAQ